MRTKAKKTVWLEWAMPEVDGFIALKTTAFEDSSDTPAPRKMFAIRLEVSSSNFRRFDRNPKPVTVSLSKQTSSLRSRPLGMVAGSYICSDLRLFGLYERAMLPHICIVFNRHFRSAVWLILDNPLESLPSNVYQDAEAVV